MLAILAMALAVAASTPQPLTNPDFEIGAPGETPTGWKLPDSSARAGYRFEAIEAGAYQGRMAARLTGPPSTDPKSAFGAVSQGLDAAALRGHRIRFTAAARAGEIRGWTGLWLRVDGADGKLLFIDNMADRPITQHDWATYTIDAWVPEQATRVVAGMLLAGSGEAFFDQVRLEDLGVASGEPTGEAKAYLDSALDLLQANHINRDKADWPAIRTAAYAGAAGATRPAQTYSAIRGAIAALGERHTLLIPPNGNAPPQDAAGQPVRPPLPMGRIADGIGLIALPRLTHNDTSRETEAAYAKTIRALLAQGDTTAACWIVDLRGHSGGTMWPGVFGFSPLLGAGPHGAFASGEKISPWSVDPKPGPLLRRPDAPIAVLVGPHTGSAGEDITIAFIGRPHTRLFGQPTAGLTTANHSLRLSDGAVLAVSTGWVVDRTGRRYDGPITPDETVPLDQAESAARRWLADQGCGGHV